MGIRKYKPTTPGRRGSSRRRLRRGHPVHAGEVAGPSAAQEGRPQQPRPDHHPAPGWRPQARLPHHRLPSLRQGRRAGQGRAHRVRPQPHRAHRAAALRRRREALHHRAEGPARRATPVETGPSADIKPGNNLPLRNIPVGTVDPRHRAPARRRRQDRPLGRQRASSSSPRTGPTRQLRMPSGEIRNVDVRCRATVGEVGNAEQSQHQLGQGRPHALEGQAPDRPRCRHEPGRPPARWWRGQDLRWSPPGQPVGQARGPHPPPEQGQRQARSSVAASTGKKR